jgi:UPF0716 protein FxsA
VLRQLPFILLALVVAEIWLLVVIGGQIGGLATFGLLVAGALAGGWVARREGRRAIAAWQQAQVTGEVPAPQLAASAMIVVGGVLLMIPGVITDVAGLLLLVPPVRKALSGRFSVAFADRMRTQGLGMMGMAGRMAGRMPGRGGDRPAAQNGIIDVDPSDVREN